MTKTDSAENGDKRALVVMAGLDLKQMETELEFKGSDLELRWGIR